MSGPSGLVEVRENHRFDMRALERFLAKNLEDYQAGASIQQFAGGQSNPTFLLSCQDRSLVLRKKPPGELLPSAHMVEREYRVYRALSNTGVPVPKVYLLCEDASIIGTPFFLMEHVEGCVHTEPALPTLTSEQRRNTYFEMIRVLATLHSVDVQTCGLSDFGKPGNYFARQTARWTKQYSASQTDDIASMNRLMKWLKANVPEDDTTSIVHGDFQLYNMVYDTAETNCLAVLDWELSTLGNPLADLAYNCMKYHSKGPDNPAGIDGVPSEQEMLHEYCRLTRRDNIGHWNFCLAFSFFRLASIVQGVYQRGLQGNASSDRAISMKSMITDSADKAWEIACRS